MGVSTNFYTIYGFAINGINEKFMDAHYESGEEPFVLFDGMCGEYTIFGIKLFDSGDARYGFEDGQGFATTDISTLPDLKEDYKNKFIETFPEFKHYVEGKHWKIISLAHHS